MGFSIALIATVIRQLALPIACRFAMTNGRLRGIFFFATLITLHTLQHLGELLCPVKLLRRTLASDEEYNCRPLLDA